MRGHGGNKHKQNAADSLASARTIHANGKGDRQTYNLAGLAVESLLIAIGLKSRSLMQVPSVEHGAQWHDLTFLMKQHGIWPAFNNAIHGDRSLAANWLVVKDWQSNARFADITVTKSDALAMLNATGHKTHGVFQWLLNHYEQI